MSSSSSTATQAQLPASLTQEIDRLAVEIQRYEPRDVLQYCANYFNRRLEAQRAEHLTKLNQPASQHSNARAPGMADPFAPGMRPVAEEDEQDAVASPTDAQFPASTTPDGDKMTSPSSQPSTGFGSFAGFGSATTLGSTTDQQLPTNYNLNRRTSVSAESLNPASASESNWTPPSYPKTAEQQSRLQHAVAANFLFAHLDDDQAAQVLDALQEKLIPAKGIKVIVQGDVGDYFYVVERGTFDVFVNKSGKLEAGPDGLGDVVGSVGPGGSFGELALMYNAPRAATVVSTEPAVLWQLDRVTFRRILMDSAFQRRRMYESFLGEVKILETLTNYERSKIADALETQKYPAGSTIIHQGEPGTNFYILESGEAEAYKKDTNDDKPVAKYKKGDYFGELALLNDAPRAASVVAVTDVKVARLGKEGFQRLLGPVESIMRRKNYASGDDGTASGGLDPLEK